MADRTGASATNSGIQKLSNGEAVIPASTRADGSVRKEIKVKPGYRPPEDVEVYKNRTAEGFRNRGKGGVPGAAPIEEKLPPHKAAALKNAKRREARRKAAAAGADTEQDGAESTEAGKESEAGQVAGKMKAEVQEEAVDPEVEAAKEARKLAKKLRQARELKTKKESGDGLLPEQFAKVTKIQELIRQLDALGYDAEGERKEQGEAGKEREPAG
ncbi:partner of Y14 and mago-like [Teratosphaeria destructans]|uniref:Partner of Y14 and mago-like n=1 Tax=Teratosphaeria destructans TaxID=418781 RepID=A0A9W7SWZ3_9PEZI|nr:partner of Y14 and mago-like [Teratosphaeria destructans]